MSRPARITDGLPYLYAEDLDGRPRTVTITGWKRDEFPHAGGKKEGFSLAFAETEKLLGVTSATVRLQLAAATGTRDLDVMVGKQVELFPVRTNSPLARTGLAIRVRKAKSTNQPSYRTDEPTNKTEDQP